MFWVGHGNITVFPGKIRDVFNISKNLFVVSFLYNLKMLKVTHFEWTLNGGFKDF